MNGPFRSLCTANIIGVSGICDAGVFEEYTITWSLHNSDVENMLILRS